MPSPTITLRESTAVWGRIGLLSFGGPAGQIALMHRELVDDRQWIDEGSFLHALNYCMLLPGPEAQQLATYIGWRLNGVAGGLIAGTLFILPGFLAILALSVLYVTLGMLPWVEAIFFGLRAAVIALIAQALVRMGSRLVGNVALATIAAIAFLAIFVFAVPFPLVILAAALTGYVASRAGSKAFAVSLGHPSGTMAETLPHPSTRRALITGLIFIAFWLVPVALIAILLGPDHVFTHLAAFFSKLAVVTFGGAYAVLAWVAQAAVDQFGWLQPGEMLDGMGLAETTPGPLILVLQFVGFLAAYRDPGMLHPLLAGTIGATLTVWVTFMPCFAWIFLGAPWSERLRANRALSAALTAVTAGVVGVIANLALWIALHSLFAEHQPSTLPATAFEWPVLASADWPAILLSLAAIIAALRFKAGLLPLLGGSAAAGLLLGFAGWA